MQTSPLYETLEGNHDPATLYMAPTDGYLAVGADAVKMADYDVAGSVPVPGQETNYDVASSEPVEGGENDVSSFNRTTLNGAYNLASTPPIYDVGVEGREEPALRGKPEPREQLYDFAKSAPQDIPEPQYDPSTILALAVTDHEHEAEG